MNRNGQIVMTAALVALMLAVAASGAQAAAGGNSAAAQLCQKGGWEGLLTNTGEPLSSQGECVSYAARGGLLSPEPTLSFVLTLGTCAPSSFPTYLECPGSSWVGSGLMPGAEVRFCSTDPCGPTGIFVEADGTLPDHLASFTVACLEDFVFTYRTTTAAGTTIDTTYTCSL